MADDRLIRATHLGHGEPGSGPAAIEVVAPARVDLAGGTLDLWPLWCFHPGAVTVNVAISPGVRLRLVVDSSLGELIRHRGPDGREALLGPLDRGQDLTAAVGFHFRPEGGVFIDVREQPEVGSGLGGSSAYAVALARACLHVAGSRLSPATLVGCLRDLEASVLVAPTGVQDYWPALLGGPLALSFAPGGVRVERLATPTAWLADRLVLIDSGIAHASGMVNWEVYRARVEGNRTTTRALEAIVTAAQRCRDALLAADEEGIGVAIAADWTARRMLAPEVAPPAVEAMIAAGLRAGALAGKACGAGGGGAIAFWTPPLTRAAVAAAALQAAPAGARQLPVATVGRPPAVRVLPST